MTENQAVQQKSVRRNRVAAAACVAAALIAVGVVGTRSATANEPVHPATATATTAAAAVAVPVPGLGSARLVQSEDQLQQGLNPVGATVALTGRQGLSACSGEQTMRDLTKGRATAYASVTWTFATDGLLIESAASAPTGPVAATWEQQLVALVQDCQHEPAGHWYYGAAHTLTAAGGTAHWYPSYNGDGAASGGVAVLRSGTRVALVELTGPAASVEAITTAALKRLAS
ncbi:hypothetical protein OG401_20455 [Kitasatospora purpeofusca]|uniref:hypothetical protein n=1 Tax=Kitasatospora purpeofusca TaxID=67352 RepID=UPI002253943E|nr:hypothetical protein [Kitasatospora purpeofusca]MCX4686651.1 hypothetical protein [Kitasatospora purpeofusca]